MLRGCACVWPQQLLSHYASHIDSCTQHTGIRDTASCLCGYLACSKHYPDQTVRRGAGTEGLAQDQTRRSGVWTSSCWTGWSVPCSLKYQRAVEPGHPSLLAEDPFPVEPLTELTAAWYSPRLPLCRTDLTLSTWDKEEPASACFRGPYAPASCCLPTSPHPVPVG